MVFEHLTPIIVQLSSQLGQTFVCLFWLIAAEPTAAMQVSQPNPLECQLDSTCPHSMALSN